MQRIVFSETASNGNGFGGDDETSENIDATFSAASPTPGTIP